MRCLSIVIVLTLTFTAVARADEESDLRDSIIATLIAATEDGHLEVRYAAYSALRRQPKSEALAKVFRRGLEDGDERIRKISLEQHVVIEGPTTEVLDYLISLLAADDLDGDASTLLLGIGPPAVPKLIEALSPEDESTTPLVLGILVNIQLGDQRKEAVQKTQTLLSSKTVAVRVAAVDALRQFLSATSQVQPDARYLSYARSMISRYDTNGDGVITKEELSGASASLELADMNRDGRITEQEIASYFTRRRQNR